MPNAAPNFWQFSAAFPALFPTAAFPAAAFPAGPFDFGAMSEHLAQFQQRLADLNASFAREMSGEVGFDWATCFSTADVQELYVRQLGNEVPLLTIPVHYVSAVMDLCAAAQRAWIDGCVQMFGLTPWFAPLGLMHAAQTPGEAVVDVPPSVVRETRKVKGTKAD